MYRNSKKPSKVRVAGIIEKGLEFSHKTHGKEFYRTRVIVSRKYIELSDYIPIMISDVEMLSYFKAGVAVLIEGVLRSYRRRGEDGVLHSETGILVEKVEVLEDIQVPINKVALIGCVVEKPFKKNTSKEKELCTLLINVDRGYGKSDYINCYTLGENAEKAIQLNIGDSIEANGNLRSRVDPVKNRIYYEVFIGKFEKV